ncbi:hypothetical protein STIAU_4907 [Stigmatella aurantiaca DW4/3-1]|uniref:Uncharacterized protein n=1 Tax=Stigmatella aurantiaca (strain DW4/3-1) TaxID=378806 RepID=Q08NS6_STIAD|nr:hypothetical protein STIAU_4907 [Stigmatella aurantiaca DW4/3-1]
MRWAPAWSAGLPLLSPEALQAAGPLVARGDSRQRGRWAEELVMALVLGDAQFLQGSLDGCHEGLGAEEIDINVPFLGQPLRQPLTIQQADGVGRGRALDVLGVAVEAPQVGMLFHLGVDPLPEGMDSRVACAMDEVNGPSLGQRGRQHGQGRGDAYPATDQHQGLAAGPKVEFPRWGEQLQRIAHPHVVVQVRGGLAAGLALDADPVMLAIGGRRQRVVAARLDAIDEELHANVLPWHEVHQRASIHGRQVEGGDFSALLFLADDAEAAPALPAPPRLGLLIVHLRLAGNEQIGQLLVCGAPGGDHFIGGHLRAENLADGAQQARAHDGVMRRLDLQGHMLVDDLHHESAELFQLVNVAGIPEHRVGQGTGLRATALVGLIEQGPHLGMLAQHDAVEMRGQGLAAALQQGHGGFDDGTLMGAEHERGSGRGFAAGAGSPPTALFRALMKQLPCRLLNIGKSKGCGKARSF